MTCPYCASDRDRVVDSRAADVGRAIRRRRECEACGQRYSTYERVEHAPLAVRKRSGSIQPFDPERINAGMQKATANLDIADAEVRIAAARVEAHLRSMGRREIGTDEIGGHVLEALRTLHHVAYVRFASVHRSFTSADDFAEALATLDAPTQHAPNRDVPDGGRKQASARPPVTGSEPQRRSTDRSRR